jgi:hypothetical protein
MGKYWYQDSQKRWRQGDDTDDFFVGIITLVLMGLGWVFGKPITWWVLKREEPTEGQITLWAIVSIVLVLLIIYLCSL